MLLRMEHCDVQMAQRLSALLWYLHPLFPDHRPRRLPLARRSGCILREALAEKNGSDQKREEIKINENKNSNHEPIRIIDLGVKKNTKEKNEKEKEKEKEKQENKNGNHEGTKKLYNVIKD